LESDFVRWQLKCNQKSAAVSETGALLIYPKKNWKSVSLPVAINIAKLNVQLDSIAFRLNGAMAIALTMAGTIYAASRNGFDWLGYLEKFTSKLRPRAKRISDTSE
jgi:hypothetical protein